MAERKVSFILELKDLLTSPISGVISKLGNLRASYLALAAAISGVLSFLKESLEEYGKSQEAVAKLEGALKRTGQASTGAKERLLDQASALQKVTTYTDEAVIEMQALLTTFGMNEAAVTLLIPRILDLSAATGVDLRSATVALAKAIQTGSVSALQRYGISIDETALKFKDFNAIAASLDKRFLGQAELMGRTIPGQATRLQNAISDLMETVGKFVAGPAGAFTELLISVVHVATEVVGKIDRLTNGLRMFGTTLGQIALRVGSLIPGIGGLAALVADFTTVTSKSTKETEKKTEALKDQVPALDNVIKKEIELNRFQIQGPKTATEVYRQELAKRMAATEDWFDQNISFNDALRLHFQEMVRSNASIFVGTVDTMVNSFSSGIAQLIVYGGSFEDTMRRVGQNVLEYFIQQVIAQMVARWLAGIAIMNAASATLGVPGVGVGAAGAAGAGGAAAAAGAAGAGLLGLDFMVGQKNGLNPTEGAVATGLFGITGGSAVVSGVKNVAKKIKKKFSGGVINEPTLMMGMKSGAIGLAGERGIPEALISFPEMGLTPSQGRERLLGGGGGGGGGSVVINIQAGNIVADDYSVRQFAKRIDEELFRLDKNKQGVS